MKRGLFAALALTALCAGCGGGTPDLRSQQGPAGFGQPLTLADCSDWNKAELNQRVNVVRELHKFASGPVGSPPVRGRAMDDERAYKILDNYCQPEFARGFKLYKLYLRAAAFSRQKLP